MTTFEIDHFYQDEEGRVFMYTEDKMLLNIKNLSKTHPKVYSQVILDELENYHEKTPEQVKQQWEEAQKKRKKDSLMASLEYLEELKQEFNAKLDEVTQEIQAIHLELKQ